jgi:3-(methylthio)propanoyl-CoA dehydrogenase
VLGGAGYTREWPVEQALRDVRVLTIFEGTTGIQALDMLHRRLGRETGEPLRAFARLAAATTQGEGRKRLEEALDLVTRIGSALATAEPAAAEASATGFLHLAAAVALAWIAVRQLDADDPRDRALAAHWLSNFDARLAMLANESLPNPDLAARFAAIEAMP